ncbi:MAG: YdeI/OmpD-associated family protein [Bacteroidota bacterium]|nr:YdeI/OmpD-associated family protein [Bacteroidota bacterium]
MWQEWLHLKNYVAIWFFQGALLRDEKGVLVNAQEGTTKALRQWRFKSFEEIEERKEDILDYLQEAVRNQQQGKEIKARIGKPLIIPKELELAFQKDAELKACFDSLNLSHQREFADHISEAKKAETRLRRLEKIIPMIKRRKGLNDKYRK